MSQDDLATSTNTSKECPDYARGLYAYDAFLADRYIVGGPTDLQFQKFRFKLRLRLDLPTMSFRLIGGSTLHLVPQEIMRYRDLDRKPTWVVRTKSCITQHGRMYVTRNVIHYRPSEMLGSIERLSYPLT